MNFLGRALLRSVCLSYAVRPDAHTYSLKLNSAILFVRHTGEVQGLVQINHLALLHLPGTANLTGGKRKHLLSDVTLNPCPTSKIGIKYRPQILLHVLHVLVFLFSRTSISQFLLSSQPHLRCCPVTSKHTCTHALMFSAALFTRQGGIRGPQNMALHLPTAIATTSCASLSIFCRFSS